MSIDWESVRRDALASAPFPGLPEGVTLPALPGAVNAFIARSADPNASARELASIVESDSGLTCELLKYVNSGAFVGRRTIANISQAVASLGIRQTKMFVISAGTKAAMLATSTRVINLNSFWNEVLQRALFSREVAHAGKIAGDVSFGGALLQDFLLPVLTSVFPDEYYEFLRLSREEQADLCEYEQRVFGWDHATAAAHVAHHWNLPDELTCCVFYHHRIRDVVIHPQLGDSPCLPVAISALLAGQMRQERNGEPRLVELVQSTGAFDLSAVCESVDAQQEEMANGIRIEFPLTRRFDKLLEQDTTAAGKLSPVMAIR
ncbi:MAG: HDOD domain-containing protein [Planctomycetaceae bacterium]